MNKNQKILLYLSMPIFASLAIIITFCDPWNSGEWNQIFVLGVLVYLVFISYILNKNQKK